MTNNNYFWTDNPTVQNVAKCDTDVLNECLMHLKYDNQSGDSLPLFTAIAFDHALRNDEAIGWALQGSCVTMTYPDAVEKIKSLYAEGVEWEYRGIPCKKTFDGRFIADISQKNAIDELYVTTGVADFYVLDTINQQFYLPRNDWFVQGTSDPNNVNQFNEAGLPNVEGLTGWEFQNTEQGAFTSTNLIRGRQGAASTSAEGIKFDASRSNPIYGKSTTVQPLSSLKLVYYKVGKTIVNEALVDIGQVLSDLQLKTDIDLSNATPSQAFKEQAVSWGMPDYTKGFTITSGYTAVMNGICILMNSAGPTGVLTAFINGSLAAVFGSTSTNDRTIQLFLNKGDIVTWTGGSGGNQIYKFYPLKGAK